MKKQDGFLNSTLGKLINTGVDIGIRAILPDLIENQVIELKDNLLNYGLKDGISKTTQSAIDIGKSAIGIVTGKFDNVSQMRLAVQNGGLIDSLSDVLDFTVDKVKNSGLINNSTAKLIKNGKNMILNNVESNIEKMFENQAKNIEFLGKYIDNWKVYYNSQSYSDMNREYNKIKKIYKDLAPLEKSIEEVKKINNIQKLLQNKGGNFSFTNDELEMLEKI